MQKKLLLWKAFFEWNITKVAACKEWKKKSNIIIFAEEKYHIFWLFWSILDRNILLMLLLLLCCCLVDFEIFASNTKIKACLIFF